jgi:hypothetical protein
MHVLTQVASDQDKAFCVAYIKPLRAVEGFAEGGLKGYLARTAALSV